MKSSRGLAEQTTPQIVPMDDIAFWYIIRRCDSFSTTNARYYNVLWSSLSETEPRQTFAFALKLLVLKRRLNSWDLWAMWQYIMPSTTRSEFSGFQNVLISMGPDTFERVCSDPDNLVLDIDRLANKNLVFQDFARVPGEILRSTHQHSLLAFLDETDRAVAELETTRLEGDHWDITQGALAARFPRWTALLNNSGAEGAESRGRALN